MTPTEATKPENELKVYNNLYGSKSRLGELQTESSNTSEIDKKVFKVGQMVRTHLFGTKFDRGYKPQFAEEILNISEILPTNAPTYKLVDYQNNSIKGSYYSNEITPYNKQNEDYEYEYIIETKKTDDPNIFKALVKWKGYSDRFNSWVDLTPEQVQESFHKKPFKKKQYKTKERVKHGVAKGK